MESQVYEKIRSILRLIRPEEFSYLFPGYGDGQFSGHVSQGITADYGSSFTIESKSELFPTKDRRGPFRDNPGRSLISPEKVRPGIDYFSLKRDDFDETEWELEEQKAEKIRQAIQEIQDQYGITIEEFEMYLSYTRKPSRLVISPSGKITLPDYDWLEVKMDTLAKAVYILYLRHPEGIGFKDMPDHQAEMLDIYRSLSNRSDTSTFTKSIERLCNTVENNSLNEKVSRIKRAFLNVMDERIAQYYYIKGPAGGIRKIDLDRNLIKVM